MYDYEVFRLSAAPPRPAAYGILCRARTEPAGLLAAAAPLSEDYGDAARLAARCNALQLSPEQLLDAAADFLQELRRGGPKECGPPGAPPL